MSLHVTERLIQRQLNHWNRLRDYLHEREQTAPPARRPVITVSRMAASGGRTLACALARRLDLEVQDDLLITAIAADRKLERSLVEQLDERTVSQTRLWVQGVLQRRLFLRDDYHLALVRVITALAARGGAVILGRGANLILGEQADLRVRVVASLPRRCERMCERDGVTRAEARGLLAEIDGRRERFIREVFATEPGLAANFDLVLNADRLDTGTMVDHVLLALAGTAVRARASLQDQG